MNLDVTCETCGALPGIRCSCVEDDSAVSLESRVADLTAVLTMVRDDFDQAVAAHDSSDPRHRSHGGQHHNGPCCEFGSLTPGSVRHMKWLRGAIDAALTTKATTP